MAGRPKRKKDLVALDTMGEAPVAELLESAMPIAEVCRTLGVGKRALMEWLERDESRAGLLSHARARAAHHLADQALEIADSDDGDVPARRLRVDTRRWLAGRWNPNAYGEKNAVAVQVNVSDLHLDALRSVKTLEQVDKVDEKQVIEASDSGPDPA